jgi:hypothetical protein
MTNFTVAVILFTLETNWIPLATITPIPTGRSNYNSTVRQIEEAEVWKVKWFVNHEDGRELKMEAKREAVALTNQLLRIVPTNFPPSQLYSLPLRTLVHRQDAAPVPVPPLPPGRTTEPVP